MKARFLWSKRNKVAMKIESPGGFSVNGHNNKEKSMTRKGYTRDQKNLSVCMGVHAHEYYL